MKLGLRRRLLRALGAMPLAAALPGCIGPGQAPAHLYYELDDPGAAAPRATGGGASAGTATAAGNAAARASARTLLVDGVAANAFLDGTAIAYSRAPGARASYQFASWTERPAARIARLLARRLATSGAFADVASATAPVRGDWLLELQLEQLYHDDLAPPGVARIELVAELTGRAARRTIGRRRFAQAEPLANESAAQAAAAFGRALGRLLDEAQDWVVAQAARPAAAVSEPGAAARSPSS
ncbi:MAG: PqiC family protein [Burkholderiaceae bacterium]|nr:PqiC family protein [Burkholderiaceae bacterium]